MWARSFSVAEQRTDERLRAILATSASASDPAQRQLGRHWQACMDADGRTAADLQLAAVAWAVGTAIGVLTFALLLPLAPFGYLAGRLFKK